MSWLSKLNPFRARKALAPPERAAGVVLKSAAEVVESLDQHDSREPLWAFNVNTHTPTNALNASTWVSACTGLISKLGAGVRLRVKQGDAYLPTNTPRGANPLHDLINEPVQGWSQQMWTQTVTYYMLLQGSAYLKKDRATITGQSATVDLGIPGGTGLPAQLWPFHEGEVVAERENLKRRRVIGYRIANEPWQLGNSRGGRSLTPLSEVVHCRFVRPGEHHRGYAPTEAAAPEAEADQNARRWQAESFKNRAIPDLAFIFDKQLTREQQQSAYDHIKTAWAGAFNARKPMVMGGIVDAKPLGFNAKEMDFTASRDQLMKWICALYNVPTVLFDAAGSTFSNLEVAQYLVWQFAVLPMLDLIAGALNTSLVPEFGDPNQSLAWDTSHVDALLPILRIKSEIATGLRDLGMPMSQINEKLDMGLDGWAHWDLPIIPSGYVALASLAQPVQETSNDSTSTAPGDAPDNPLEEQDDP